jgi:hypothetical protein
MIRFKINLSYPAATLNTRLRQDMILLSYPVSYPAHQADPNFFGLFNTKFLNLGSYHVPWTHVNITHIFIDC